MSDWLWRILQAAIVIAVGWWMIYMKFTNNGILIGLVGVGAAFILTVVPLKIWLWLLERRDGRAIVPPPRSARVVSRDEPTEHDLDLL